MIDRGNRYLRITGGPKVLDRSYAGIAERISSKSYPSSSVRGAYTTRSMAVSGDEAIVTRFPVSWDPMAACASSSARLPAGAQDVQEQGGIGKRDVVVNGEKDVLVDEHVLPPYPPSFVKPMSARFTRHRLVRPRRQLRH